MQTHRQQQQEPQRAQLSTARSCRILKEPRDSSLLACDTQPQAPLRIPALLRSVAAHCTIGSHKTHDFSQYEGFRWRRERSKRRRKGGSPTKHRSIHGCSSRTPSHRREAIRSIRACFSPCTFPILLVLYHIVLTKVSFNQKWGAVDTSSTGNALSSIYGSIAKKTPTPPDSSPPVPAAFPPKKNTFAPPPVRRGVSDSQSTHAPPPPPPPPVAQEEPEEEEAHGEWAEALYDYESEVKVIHRLGVPRRDSSARSLCVQEPGDLNIREKQRVLVTERTSDDWCV